MMLRVLLAGLLLGSLAGFTACKKKHKPSLDEECKGISCFIYYRNLAFRLVNRETGDDLLFGPHASIPPDSVELFADEQLHNRLFKRVVTDTAAGNTYLLNPLIPEVAYLRIARPGAAVTVDKLQMDFIGVDCCSARVKTLSLNGQPVCTSCANIINIPIPK
jgi:hypothetical protein